MSAERRAGQRERAAIWADVCAAHLLHRQVGAHQQQRYPALLAVLVAVGGALVCARETLVRSDRLERLHVLARHVCRRLRERALTLQPHDRGDGGSANRRS